MKLQKLPYDRTVCKVSALSEVRLHADFFFLAKTDEELSLVTKTEDGWKGFRIAGTLDFSLTGILSRIANLPAEAKLPIFAVSTYNTDYILVKAEHFKHAMRVLVQAGYEID